MVHVKWVNLTNKNVDDQSLGYSLFEKEFLFEFALGMVYLSDYWLNEVTKVVVWLSPCWFGMWYDFIYENDFQMMRLCTKNDFIVW